MTAGDFLLWLRCGAASAKRDLERRLSLRWRGLVTRAAAYASILQARQTSVVPRFSAVWREGFNTAARRVSSVARVSSEAYGSTDGRTPESRLESSFARCAQITRRASTNFYYAFMLLPPERRRALYAVYAFCRFVDDIADDASVREPAQMLARWRDELDRVYRGQPTRPVSRALAATVKRFAIAREHFEEIIAGVEMDLARPRYETFEELKLYCRRVASAVGLICIEIFGCRDPLTKEYADNLGIAFQLTNILRDVGEDAARGRIYLPLKDLAQFKVEPEEILRGAYSERFTALMRFEAARARSYYDAAAAALTVQDRPALVAAEGMRAIYRALLERIVNADYRVFGRRQSLSIPRKLYLVTRVWVGGRLRQATAARNSR